MAEAPHQSTGIGFRSVDQTADPGALIGHLDRASTIPRLQERKQRMFAMLALRPGDGVLDAGCGVGTDLIEMVRLVAPDGRAVGVDLSETLVAEARRRADGSGLPVEFRQGNLARLDFPGDTFHGCHAERVPIHVENPAAVLAELVRVLRPSGRLVVWDLDYGLRAVDLPDRDVQRRIDAWRADTLHRNGWIGRQLPRLFKQAGPVDIAVTPEPQVHFGTPSPLTENYKEQVREARDDGAITREEADAHLAALDAAVADGTIFQAAMTFTVAGRKR